MTGSRAVVLAAAAVALLTSPVSAAETVDIESPSAAPWFCETYYGVFRGESRVGWVRRALVRGTFEEQPTVARSVESFLDVAGDGNTVTLEERVTYLAEGDQLLARIERTTERQGVRWSRHATRRGGRFDVVTLRDGKEIEGAVRAIDVSLADELALERLVLAAAARDAGQVGAEATSSGMDLRNMQPTQQTLQVTEKVELDGGRVGYVVAVKLPDGRLSQPLVVDDEGLLVRGAMGSGLRLERMSKLAATTPAGRASMEVAERLPMEGRLADLATLSELVISMPAPPEDAPPPFPSTGRQSVTTEKGRLVVRVRPALDAGVADDAAVQAALAAERGIDPADKAIRKAADLALVGTSSRAVQVRRLAHFVAQHVADAVVLEEPSAAEILAGRRGDCTEHVRLFVALARASGIPAREVTGVVWMGDDQQAFGWHAWAEVALLGRWRLVDPTTGAMPAHAAHLRIDTAARDAGVLSGVELRLEKTER